MRNFATQLLQDELIAFGRNIKTLYGQTSLGLTPGFLTKPALA